MFVPEYIYYCDELNEIMLWYGLTSVLRARRPNGVFEKIFSYEYIGKL